MGLQNGHLVWVRWLVFLKKMCAFCVYCTHNAIASAYSSPPTFPSVQAMFFPTRCANLSRYLVVQHLPKLVGVVRYTLAGQASPHIYKCTVPLPPLQHVCVHTFRKGASHFRKSVGASSKIRVSGGLSRLASRGKQTNKTRPSPGNPLELPLLGHDHLPTSVLRPLSPPQSKPAKQAAFLGGGGGLGWVGSTPHPDLRDHGRRPSLRVTTGPAGARLSGLKAYQTDDRPHAPRWHTREGDAAVPVCMGRACCLCVWGVSWRGHEARRVTRQHRAWPGPGPVSPARGGGLWAGCRPLRRAPGGGGGLSPTSARPTLAQRGDVSAFRRSATVLLLQA